LKLRERSNALVYNDYINRTLQRNKTYEVF